MKKSSFLLYNYKIYFFLIKLKIRIKIKNVKKIINDILKIFLKSIFVLNNKLHITVRVKPKILI